MILDGWRGEHAQRPVPAVGPGETAELLEAEEVDRSGAADGCIGPVRIGDEYEDDDQT